MEKVRGRLVNFRVTDDEFEQLKTACDRQGARCLSAFARKIMLNAPDGGSDDLRRDSSMRWLCPASKSTLSKSKNRGIAVRLLFVILIFLSSALAQPARRAIPDAGANLPSQPIGRNDLISVYVYDAPEFSRTFRIGADGY